MPSIFKSNCWITASKPVLLIALTSCVAGIGCSLFKKACSVERLTFASTTPSIFFKAFSTRATQEAQVIPEICTCCSYNCVVAGVFILRSPFTHSLPML